jgi:4-hydroxybenzoate polyprenyltransferase
MAAEPIPWRRVATAAGLTSRGDLPFLLWPLLWAGWLAGAGEPDPWRLAALMMAVLLGRSAAWSGFLPELSRVGDAWRERRFLILFFGAGALCFALPLGAAGWLIPATLAVTAAWYSLRQRSYLSDPLLAAALMLPALAAWLAVGGGAARSAGLLLLAVALWVVAALITSPLQRGSANLAALLESHARMGALVLRLAALFSLWLAGRPAHLGLWFWLGLGLALVLDLLRWSQPAPVRSIAPWLWEAIWGGAIFVGVVASFA